MSADPGSTRTRDTANIDGWSVLVGRRSAEQLEPRLRLLYHVDLDRIGALSVPGALSPQGLVLGRNEPSFGGLGAPSLPIDDPHVSREQLRIRWLPEPQRFEVEPAPSARRPLRVVDLDRAPSGAIAMTPVTSALSLPPGACLAIG